MSLVYFVTALPRLLRGTPPPIDRPTFIARARADLPAKVLVELERVLLLEELFEGVRIQANAVLADPDTSAEALAQLMYDRDPATEGGPAISELPSWMLRPNPLREQLRHFWHDVGEDTSSDFLWAWADFQVNFWEVVTGLLAKRAELGREAFMQQMSGSFDTTALFLIAHYDEPEAGLSGRFAWIPTAIDALGLKDQQACERVFNDIQWRALDAFCGIEPFATDTVLAFYLRLRLLEREASWSQTRGDAVLDGALDAAKQMIERSLNSEAA